MPKSQERSTVSNVWLQFKLFVMKWRFRLDQARALFGLVTFAALLAIGYKGIMPWFKDQAFWRGEFLLTFLIFIIFALGGYIYDRTLKLWTETQKIAVQRSPYTYVPAPKEVNLSAGMWYYIFNALEKISEKLDIELEGVDHVKYLSEHYYKLDPSTPDFEKEAVKLRKISKMLEEIFIDDETTLTIDEFIVKAKEMVEEKKSKKK